VPFSKVVALKIYFKTLFVRHCSLLRFEKLIPRNFKHVDVDDRQEEEEETPVEKGREGTTGMGGEVIARPPFS
jgi:hypothetical protein